MDYIPMFSFDWSRYLIEPTPPILEKKEESDADGNKTKQRLKYPKTAIMLAQLEEHYDFIGTLIGEEKCR